MGKTLQLCACCLDATTSRAEDGGEGMREKTINDYEKLISCGYRLDLRETKHLMTLYQKRLCEVKRMSVEIKDDLFQEMLTALKAAHAAFQVPSDSVIYNMAEAAIKKAIGKAEKVK